MALNLFSSGSVMGKGIVIGMIVLALIVPLSMLHGLVSERTGLRDQAYATVAEGWGGEVTTGGPIIVVPVDRSERNEKGERVIMRRHLYVLPTTLKVDVKIVGESERRRVGIYEVPVYLAHVKVTGEFAANSLNQAIAKSGAESTYHFDRARLRLPLSTTKSLRELTSANLDGTALSFVPARPGVLPGIEADLVADARMAKAMKFEFEMVLAGSRDFFVLPLGATTQVAMASAWPDPKFMGQFLPATRTIGKTGFDAAWQVLELNRTYSQAWLDSDIHEPEVIQSAFGVRLFQSVDVYQRSERAVKYALLFIALTFLSFLAWEQISKVPVHPMQYLLIGLALSVFYLLLIALTEHIQFAYAYWTAASALISLLTMYTAAALRGAKRGIAVGGAMAVTYSILYMLVLSEQYALLMGAITLFITLAVVMLATRRVQWYRG